MTAITHATPGDADAMAAILSDWIDATPWMPRIHSRAADRAFCAALVADQAVWVARGPAVLGFLARDGDCVTALYLAPGARGRGIGPMLLAAAQAGAARLTLWTFAANAGARRFYAREGFTQIGATGGDNDEGLPDLHLCWTPRGTDA